MTRHKFLIIVSLIIFNVSCKKDFLEVIDKTKLLREGYVVDLETTGHYMNGIYTEIAVRFANAANLPLPELAADNIKPRSTGTTGINPNVYRWTVTKEFDLAGPWYDNYRIIRACNFVLEKSEEYKSQDAVKTSNLKAQALSIRAWMHFNLVNMFAQSFNYTTDASHMGVPYLHTSDINEPISRQSVAQVYSSMLNDLNEALSLFSATSITNNQFMNYQAAKSLLARVYLFKEDFTMAKIFAVQVLNTVPLMISNYPSNLYKTTETEALFQLPPGNSTTNDYNMQFIGHQYNATTSITFLATRDIAQLYRSYPTDKRTVWVRDSTIGIIVKKFPRAVTGTHSSVASDYYQTLLRSSEMALTAAEAFAKLNVEDSARYFINQIRSRANIPTLSSVITGSALMDSIRLERRKEMAFDGIRMFDLLRWKRGVIRQDALTGFPKTLSYPNDKSIFPIPGPDVQLAGLPQNPGY